MEGFGAKKETAIFPKIVYAVCDGLNFNPEDPNWDIYQLAFECMTKSVYPDILFVTPEQVKNGTVVWKHPGGLDKQNLKNALLAHA